MKAFIIRSILFPLARLYWRVVRPRTFGVKGVVVRPGDDAVLLVRHAYGDTSIWNLPGGGYRPERETAEHAVAREIREELGLRVSAAMRLGEYRTQAQGKRDTVTIFACPVAEEAFTPNDELAEARWFSSAEIAALEGVYPITTHALALYGERASAS